MRIALLPVVVASLLWSSCYTSTTTERFMYGSNLDVCGPNLLIWPIARDGSAFRRTTQLGEGLHMLSEGYVFSMPYTGDWFMAGETDLASVIVVLPPEPGRELRERVSEISAGLSQAYPRASVHLIKTRIEPYGIGSVAQLEAKLRDAWYAHVGSRAKYFPDAFADSLIRELGVMAVAEFGILPLPGEEIRFAVWTPEADELGYGLARREATPEDLVSVLRELAAATRPARDRLEENERVEYYPAVQIRTGRVRAFLPKGAPDEVRIALEDALFELQQSSWSDDEAGMPPVGGVAGNLWNGADGLELRYMTSVQWEDQMSGLPIEDSAGWLLLYFSP